MNIRVNIGALYPSVYKATKINTIVRIIPLEALKIALSFTLSFEIYIALAANTGKV